MEVKIVNRPTTLRYQDQVLCFSDLDEMTEFLVSAMLEITHHRSKYPRKRAAKILSPGEVQISRTAVHSL